jgi:hypothetical protein
LLLLLAQDHHLFFHYFIGADDPLGKLPRLLVSFLLCVVGLSLVEIFVLQATQENFALSGHIRQQSRDRLPLLWDVLFPNLQ